MQGIQIYQLIWLILPLARCTACEVQPFRHNIHTLHNPHRLILLDINKHGLEFWMCLWCNLQQGVLFQYDLHDKNLGKFREIAHFPGALMQYFQLQQDMALQLLQQL